MFLNIFSIPASNALIVFITSILEYALQVWRNIPVYLSERIEAVQKRAFKIIYPDSSYNQALILAKDTTLLSKQTRVFM